MGSMTGRQAGFCAGYNVPGYANPVGGFGRGMGRGLGGGFGRGLGGGGRGRRNRFYATGLPGWQAAAMAPGAPAGPADEAQQLEMLKGQAQTLWETLEGIRRRIEQLEADRQD
jgi:hypothetical protein